MDKEQFEKMSQSELETIYSPAQLVSIGYKCPTYKDLTVLLNDMSRIKAEDRSIFILCDCGAVHEL